MEAEIIIFWTWEKEEQKVKKFSKITGLEEAAPSV